MPLKRKVSPLRTHLEKGEIYGVGSLLWQARKVMALLEQGTVVAYEVVGIPPRAAGKRVRGRPTGVLYYCSHRAFVLWLREVRNEQMTVHGRLR